MQNFFSSGSALIKPSDKNIDTIVIVNCGPPSPRKQAVKRIRDDEEWSVKKKELETKRQKICSEAETESDLSDTSSETEDSSIMDSECFRHCTRIISFPLPSSIFFFRLLCSSLLSCRFQLPVFCCFLLYLFFFYPSLSPLVMHILSWNIQGSGKASKTNYFNDMIFKEKPDLGFVMETKTSYSQSLKRIKKLALSNFVIQPSVGL
ncbi:hypothetical protein FRX31_007692 [Thalictrum thalictroides]|uniref:Uncharacterized protein n=1 Tax=Thalictrum thalictroides TaxID=46969 RepID=A0A7J6WZ38_THATH|nr:hypothetical protein FRX31_007692 [Thalictrum thalictroides]